MIYKIPALEMPLVKNVLDFYEFCDFRDGKATGSPDRDYKYNEELFDPIHLETLHNLVLDKLQENRFLVQKLLGYKFTKPVFLRYGKDMHYEKHNDFYIQNNTTRSDYSMTIFLNDPSEYEGGELVITVGSEELSFKENAGTAVVYQTGLDHKVNPIISGTRKVSVLWFETLINNPSIRDACSTLWDLLNDSKEDPKNAPLTKEQITQIESVRFNLIRHYGNLNLAM